MTRTQLPSTLALPVQTLYWLNHLKARGHGNSIRVVLVSQLPRAQRGEAKEGDWILRGKQKIPGIHLFLTQLQKISFNCHNGGLAKRFYRLKGAYVS